ncbi:MAG TPA: enoyl-CoA hydratase-related protein [Solirubrobacterales bacterium]|jgi:enoyl-CoA hydratase
MQFEHLRLERSEGLAKVTLDRPPVNAVNQAMYGEIRELFSRADELFPDARAVILAGEGRHFCAGNDLDEFATLTPSNSPARMKLVREAFAAIYDCPVPVIAAVQGMAAGTGVAIMASCDVVLCGESARLATPEVGVGVMGGGRHLRRVVPEQVMRLMYFTAEPVPAQELVRYGGIHAVVPDEELGDAALELSARITRHSRAALRHAKEALNTVESMDLKAGYETEQRFTSRLTAHPDSLEAREAAIEHRPPVYSHS